MTIVPTLFCIFGSRGIWPTVAEIDAVMASGPGWMAGIRAPFWVLVSGMEKTGADGAGLAWAKAKGIDVLERPADWKRYGKAAGPIRNAEMAAEVKFALGFWDGKSTGTANMAANLLVRGKCVHLVRW